MSNDTRNLISGQITWYEDRKSGRGYLRLKFEDGGVEEVQCDKPITGKVDASDVANHFGGYDWQTIERDRDFVHVTVLV